jgi:hypothetical protein
MQLRFWEKKMAQLDKTISYWLELPLEHNLISELEAMELSFYNQMEGWIPLPKRLSRAAQVLNLLDWPVTNPTVQ